MPAGVNGDRAPELKEQGALEAARDPHSSVTAEQAERKIVDEAKSAGAAAFEFDPNASPEEKARQTKAVSWRVFYNLIQ